MSGDELGGFGHLFDPFGGDDEWRLAEQAHREARRLLADDGIAEQAPRGRRQLRKPRRLLTAWCPSEHALGVVYASPSGPLWIGCGDDVEAVVMQEPDAGLHEHDREYRTLSHRAYVQTFRPAGAPSIARWAQDPALVLTPGAAFRLRMRCRCGAWKPLSHRDFPCTELKKSLRGGPIRDVYPYGRADGT